MTPFTREDSEKVATQLGTDFESIASDPSGSRPDEEAEVEAYLRYTSPEYPAFQEWEIHRAISKVKSHSAPGSDLLTISVIKHLWDWGEFRPTIIAVLNNGLKTTQQHGNMPSLLPSRNQLEVIVLSHYSHRWGK